MPLTEDDFASIKTLVERTISDRGEPFITGKVIKRDEARRLVWIAEVGDQPIPVIDFKRLVNTYSGLLSDEPYHEVGSVGEPAFQNAWGNFSAGTVETAAFYKDALGVVRLKGAMKGGTMNATAFTLPVGYRPALQLHYAVNSNNAYGTCLVNSDGTVVPFNGVNTHFALNDVSFRATASPPRIENRKGSSEIITPAIGATVLIAFERGTRRLPRCLGEIQSLEFVRAEES